MYTEKLARWGGGAQGLPPFLAASLEIEDEKRNWLVQRDVCGVRHTCVIIAVGLISLHQ